LRMQRLLFAVHAARRRWRGRRSGCEGRFQVPGSGFHGLQSQMCATYASSTDRLTENAGQQCANLNLETLNLKPRCSARDELKEQLMRNISADWRRCRRCAAPRRRLYDCVYPRPQRGSARPGLVELVAPPLAHPAIRRWALSSKTVHLPLRCRPFCTQIPDLSDPTDADSMAEQSWTTLRAYTASALAAYHHATNTGRIYLSPKRQRQRMYTTTASAARGPASPPTTPR